MLARYLPAPPVGEVEAGAAAEVDLLEQFDISTSSNNYSTSTPVEPTRWHWRFGRW